MTSEARLFRLEDHTPATFIRPPAAIQHHQRSFNNKEIIKLKKVFAGGNSSEKKPTETQLISDESIEAEETGTETVQSQQIVPEEVKTDDSADIQIRETGQADPSAVEIVANIKHIFIEKFISGMEVAGPYICRNIFRNRSEEILSDDPNNNDLWVQVLRHPDLITHKRMLWDALYAAAVKREWEEIEQHFPSLTYLHRLELSKLRDKDARLYFSSMAEAEKLSVKKLRSEISNHLKGVDPTQDKNRKILKQFTSIVDSMSKLQKPLKDRKILSSLDHQELLNLLQQTNKSLSWAPDFPEYIRELEQSIFEIVQERRTSFPAGKKVKSED